MTEEISEGDYVELEFEGEFGNQSPIQGRVDAVDRDCEKIPSTDVMIVVDERGSRNVIYAEGVHQGEEWANVSVQNRDITLGENATIRKLE